MNMISLQGFFQQSHTGATQSLHTLPAEKSVEFSPLEKQTDANQNQGPKRLNQLLCNIY